MRKNNFRQLIRTMGFSIPFFFIVSCGPDDVPADRTRYTVIKNVNLFDGEKYQANVNVVLRDSLIYSIGTAHDWPEQAGIIDGSNKTIIPPMVNAHAHVWQEEALKEAMNAGIFAMLDMHSNDSIAKALRGFAHSPDHARVYSAGPGATVPGGHGTQFGIRIPLIDEKLSPGQFVEDRVNNNADYIKIMREPTMKTLSFAQTKAIIDAAHRHSKLSVAHISLLQDAMTLNRQHIDGFMHLWFDRTISKEQADSLLQSKVFIVPTLHVTQKLLEYFQGQGMKQGIVSFDELLQETRMLHESGVPLLAGTDSPNFYFNYGSDYYAELELLAKAGLSNIEVLKAATTNVYKAFSLKEFGPLVKGAAASFVLVNGNPLNAISDIRKTEAWWKNGLMRERPRSAR